MGARLYLKHPISAPVSCGTSASGRIDNVPATDPSGYAGLADKVDFHTWRLLKGAALSTLLGVSSELALSGQGDLVQAIRMSDRKSGGEGTGVSVSVGRGGCRITQKK